MVCIMAGCSTKSVSYQPLAHRAAWVRTHITDGDEMFRLNSLSNKNGDGLAK